MSYVDEGNPVYKREYPMMECLRCEGYGRIMSISNFITCSSCNGTGYVMMTSGDYQDKKDSIKEDLKD